MTPDHDGRLHELLSSAVADLEPREGLGAIRARTDARGRSRADRPWALVLAGAVAVATVIAAVAGVGQLVTDRTGSTATPPAGPASSGQSLPTGPGAGDPSSSPGDSTTQETALPLYYLVDTERAGVRLVREFRRGARGGTGVDEALALLAGPPLDPDYRTAWPQGSLRGWGFDGIGDDGSISVRVSESATSRPAGMTSQEARAGIEQVIRTVQGTLQTRASVSFHLGIGERATELLGVPVEEDAGPGSALATLNHLNITTPEQGQSVTEKLRFTGVANSFEAGLYWEIRQGTEVVASGPATAGWQGDRLHPFEEEIDVSDLEPGDYTIWATTDDPTGGTEGAGAMTDSKEFTIP